MRKMVIVALALAPVLCAPQAFGQTTGQSGPVSGAPAGTSVPTPDLPTYGRQIQAVVEKLRAASERPDARNGLAGGRSEQAARQELLRTMQEAVGVVRSAPADFRDREEYKDAERRVRTIAQRVQGTHEPADLNGPAGEIVEALEALRAKVAAGDEAAPAR